MPLSPSILLFSQSVLAFILDSSFLHLWFLSSSMFMPYNISVMTCMTEMSLGHWVAFDWLLSNTKKFFTILSFE